MKNKFTSLLLISLSFLTITSAASSNPPVICSERQEDYQPEEPSELTRVVKLDKFGFSITVPVNNRAMLRNDGTVEIVDNGTFRLAHCQDKISIHIGRGYDALVISKSEEYLYSNVLDKVPGKENMFIVVQKFEGAFGNSYRIILRIKTPLEVIDIENQSEGGIQG